MANKGLDNKISNIIGTKVPQWLVQQFDVRADRNSDDVRKNENLLYLANKSAWVRLVSSVDIDQDRDQEYFSRISGVNVNNPQELSKNFVLFGGTSKYKEGSSYDLKSGFSFSDPNKTSGGAYGMLGKEEIQKYGYRPMPGITSVSIETQGRLGSIRAAIINFKCWDKAQLDIIDALYFKLGFTMFLEWGHTYFYTSDQPNTLKSSEDYSIVDPFRFIKIGNVGYIPNPPNKEEIYAQISKSSRESEGNYDAMLGMVTNFNFVYNQDGGYDCTLRLMGLGFLGESIKINNPATLPNLLTEEIVLLNNTLKLLDQQDIGGTGTTNQDPNIKNGKPGDLLQVLSLELTKTYDVNGVSYDTYQNLLNKDINLFQTISLSSSDPLSDKAKKGLRAELKKVSDFKNRPVFAPSNLGFNIQKVNTDSPNNPVSLNYYKLSDKALYGLDYVVNIEGEQSYIIGNRSIIVSNKNTYKDIDIDLGYLKKRYLSDLTAKNKLQSREALVTDQALVDANLPISYNFLGADLLINRSVTFLGGKSVYRFGTTYTSPVYSNAMTKDAYFFSVAIDNNKKNETGGNIKNGQATPSEVYNALINLIQGDYLDDTTFDLSFSNSNSPFWSFIDGKNKGGNPNNFIEPKVYDSLNPNTDYYYFSVKVLIPLNKKQRIQIKEDVAIQGAGGNSITQTRIEDIDSYLEAILTFNDTSLIADIKTDNQAFILRDEKKIQEELNKQDIEEAIKKQQQRLEQEALIDQISNSLSYQSALELTLRTIQVHALTRAIYSSGKPDKNIGNKIYVLEMTSDKEKDFLKQILSNGVFSPYISSFKNNFSEVNLPEDISNQNISIKDRLEIYTKYGFLSSLLGNKVSNKQIKDSYVDYSKLLTAFVIPYRINQELVAGIQTNHPVYIPFGLVLMLLNHISTMYDSKSGSSLQTPLVYIDYNPKLNFFLTNYQHLSTDPFRVLIPFEGTDDDYKDLFYTNVLTENKTAIKTNVNDKKGVPLFKPNTQDLISFKIQEYCPIKFDTDSNAYRGKLMNVLISIDYLTNLVKQYSRKDGSNNVYLKPFIEEILTTINKCIGNFNSFRLSYSDSSNTFQIVDDQLVPTLDQEFMIDPNANQTIITNRTEIPLIGKTSIAKSIETKTEISSKLGSLIAISANPVMKNKSTLSTNGDPLGFMNTGFSDRYVTNRLAIGEQNTENTEIESRIVEAISFNSTITDFYSSAKPSDTDVAQATSYYIEKMSKIKNEQSASLASSLVPVGINFTTDGIGGLNMGQAFTVNHELLPYSYTKKFRPGYIDNYNNYVGFAIVGLSHNIENNQWNTSIRTNMIAVKDKTVYIQRKITKLPVNQGQFSEETPNEYVTVEKSPPVGTEDAIKIAKTIFKQKGYSPEQVSAIIGALLQESQLNPNAINTSGENPTYAYGIAQWLGIRKENLLKRKDYSKLEVQLNYIIEEFNGLNEEGNAGKRIKSAKTLEEAIAAMASYERYQGVGFNSTFEDVKKAKETGSRIGYAKNIYNRYAQI